MVAVHAFPFYCVCVCARICFQQRFFDSTFFLHAQTHKLCLYLSISFSLSLSLSSCSIRNTVQHLVWWARVKWILLVLQKAWNMRIALGIPFVSILIFSHLWIYFTLFRSHSYTCLNLALALIYMHLHHRIHFLRTESPSLLPFP